MNECHRFSVEYDDPVLDREIELQEIVRKLKNGGSDGLVGELDDKLGTQAFRGGLA